MISPDDLPYSSPCLAIYGAKAAAPIFAERKGQGGRTVEVVMCDAHNIEKLTQNGYAVI